MPLKESKNTIRSSETNPCQKEQTGSSPVEKKTAFASRTRALILFVVLLGCAIPFVCTNQPQYSGCDDSLGSLGNLNIPKDNTQQYLGKWRSRKPIRHLNAVTDYSHVVTIEDWTPSEGNGPKQTIQVGEQTATLKRTVDFIIPGFHGMIHHKGGIYQLTNGDYVLITWCQLGTDCINAVRREGESLMLGRSKGQDCRKLVHPSYSWEELKPVPDTKKP